MTVDAKALDAAVNAYCSSIGHRSDTRGPLRKVRDDAIRAAILAYEAAKPAGARVEEPAQGEAVPVPRGWKLVPVEPTEAMLDVYWHQSGESKEMRIRTHHHARNRYAELLSATPPAPSAAGASEVVEALPYLIHFVRQRWQGDFTYTVEEALARWIDGQFHEDAAESKIKRAALTASPAPAELPRIVGTYKAGEVVPDYLLNIEYDSAGSDPIIMKFELDCTVIENKIGYLVIPDVVKWSASVIVVSHGGDATIRHKDRPVAIPTKFATVGIDDEEAAH